VLAATQGNPFDRVFNFFDSGLGTFYLLAFFVFLFALWIGLAFWVYRDASKRTDAPGLVGFFTLLSLVMPFFGPIIYMVLRPPEYLADARERQLGLEALERQSYGAHCPDCDYPVERDYLACPACLRKLREPCLRCSRPLDPRWKLCPYCETAAPPAMSGGSGRRNPEVIK
jgi:hypothetical protein